MIDPRRLMDLLRRRPADGRHCGPATMILVALLDGPAAAPELLDLARELGCRRVGPGTFFGALVRLERAGLVERFTTGRTGVAYRLSPAHEGLAS